MENEQIQPLGELTHELENVILKMVEQHDLQRGEILGIVKTYMEIHCDNEENYTDGTFPVYYYGHIDLLIKKLTNLKKGRKKK